MAQIFPWGFSFAWGSCTMPHAPVRFDLIAQNCVAYDHEGDWLYMDGSAGLQGSLYNGDWTEPVTFVASGYVMPTLTVGASTTVNGVAGQLPLGSCTVQAGGSGLPVSTTFSCTLTGNGSSGCVAAVTTNSSGVATSATVLSPGKGATNTGGNANFGTANACWTSGFWLRRSAQLMGMTGWNDVQLARNPTSGAFEFIFSPDDHETSNNWDFSISKAPSGASTLANVLDWWRTAQAGINAAQVLYFDNPVIAGAVGITDVPPTMVGITGSNGSVASEVDFPQRDWYRDYDEFGQSVGTPGAGSLCIRVIKIDCISGKAPSTVIDQSGAATFTASIAGATSGTLSGAPAGGNGSYQINFSDGSYRIVSVTGTAATWTTALGPNVSTTATYGKAMVGPNQLARFKTLCLQAMARGAKAIWAISDKDFFNVDNQDGWGVPAAGGQFPYIVQRDALLAWCETNGVPVVWATGDRHCAHVAMTSIANGDSYNHISVCATPLGSHNNTSTTRQNGNTPYPQMIWQDRDRDQLVYGKFTWDRARQLTIIQVLDNCDDTERFRVEIPAGARVPTVPGGIRQTRP